MGNGLSQDGFVKAVARNPKAKRTRVVLSPSIDLVRGGFSRRCPQGCLHAVSDIRYVGNVTDYATLDLFDPEFAEDLVSAIQSGNRRWGRLSVRAEGGGTLSVRGASGSWSNRTTVSLNLARLPRQRAVSAWGEITVEQTGKVLNGWCALLQPNSPWRFHHRPLTRRFPLL